MAGRQFTTTNEQQNLPEERCRDIAKAAIYREGNAIDSVCGIVGFLQPLLDLSDTGDRGGEFGTCGESFVIKGKVIGYIASALSTCTLTFDIPFRPDPAPKVPDYPSHGCGVISVIT